jgi:hypothetical protein
MHTAPWFSFCPFLEGQHGIFHFVVHDTVSRHFPFLRLLLDFCRYRNHGFRTCPFVFCLEKAAETVYSQEKLNHASVFASGRGRFFMPFSLNGRAADL